ADVVGDEIRAARAFHAVFAALVVQAIADRQRVGDALGAFETDVHRLVLVDRSARVEVAEVDVRRGLEAAASLDVGGDLDGARIPRLRADVRYQEQRCQSSDAERRSSPLHPSAHVASLEGRLRQVGRWRYWPLGLPVTLPSSQISSPRRKVAFTWEC